ncbi:methylmalonyl-CoA mutase family protein [Dyadobacter sp. LHD-138]|uniref:methylmalonyl-CoA mutase family protein n=1 Tax=Dyadobacter sp. LHD-138 TaxID=3071413 RepID=UPI0027E0CE66|nr:methylmalonyl-CoA mutase family protein [Dyadobacter sp. LHD-138]MDQ6478029.1 methylmalonyl-CoA mutase family protein [Dyadobacter sp. LHD-138]
MPASLFSEFGFSDKTTWKEQAKKELGKSENKINSWKIAPNLHVEAYYTAAEMKSGQFADLQNSQKKIPGWHNTPLINFDKPWPTNARIRSLLEEGADAILLNLPEPELIKSELAKTLHAVRLSDARIFFQTKINPEKLFDEISKGAGYYLKGGIANDPLANWMRSGTEYKHAIDDVCAVLHKTKTMREFRPLMIESHMYHNAGADPVQELAFLLAGTVHYVDKLTDAGISTLHALNRFFYSVSVGTDYLTEIAKLRALRFLHQKICRAYQLPDELGHPFIHAQTSSFYNTRQVAETNMIRATSEAMSAVIGGCDALTVLPYDHLLIETKGFSDRIAGNISSLLSSESYFDRVADPAAGSYLIEHLSLKLADAAWDLFLQTEEKGGLVACFETGFIQDEIEKSWLEKAASLHAARVMVGVNKFAFHETMPVPSQVSPAGDQEQRTKTLPVRNLSESWKEAKL